MYIYIHSYITRKYPSVHYSALSSAFVIGRWSSSIEPAIINRRVSVWLRLRAVIRASTEAVISL